jgi:hypothetical protein
VPDAKPKAGAKKKILGLSPYAWAGIVAGGGGILWYLKKRSASTAAAAASGTTDANTVPAGDSASSTSSTEPTTLADWIDDALSSSTNATYTNSDLLNDINDWLGGQCVSSQGFTAIGNLVDTLGVPPGYSTTPSLSVCASSSSSTGSGSGVGSTGTASTAPTGLSIPLSNAATPQGSNGPDLQSLIAQLTALGLNPAEAFNTASGAYNQATSGGGIVNIPGYGNASVSSSGVLTLPPSIATAPTTPTATAGAGTGANGAA